MLLLVLVLGPLGLELRRDRLPRHRAGLALRHPPQPQARPGPPEAPAVSKRSSRSGHRQHHAQDVQDLPQMNRTTGGAP